MWKQSLYSKNEKTAWAKQSNSNLKFKKVYKTGRANAIILVTKLP